MRFLRFALGAALAPFLIGSPARSEEPMPPQPIATDKEWQAFIEKMNPFKTIQRMREAEARARATANLRRIQLAAEAYQNQTLPKADGSVPMYPNWTLHLLPYIEQNSLYSELSTNRLGARWESVGEALQAQLGLAENKGLILTEVEANSAAAKAGFKKHDILLQWDGKSVSGRSADFQELLNKLPEKKELTARVLRAGKEVDIKGILLPAGGPNSIRTYVCPSDGTTNTLLFPEYYRYSNGGQWPNAWWTAPVQTSEAQSKVLITTFRQEDRFTARFQEGSLVITVTGLVKKDIAEVKAVKVIDGAIEHRYESIDKTPEEYRDKARDLVRAAEKNQDRIEIQKGSRYAPFGDW